MRGVGTMGARNPVGVGHHLEGLTARAALAGREQTVVTQASIGPVGGQPLGPGVDGRQRLRGRGKSQSDQADQQSAERQCAPRSPRGTHVTALSAASAANLTQVSSLPTNRSMAPFDVDTAVPELVTPRNAG